MSNKINMPWERGLLFGVLITLVALLLASIWFSIQIDETICDVLPFVEKGIGDDSRACPSSDVESFLSGMRGIVRNFWWLVLITIFVFVLEGRMTGLRKRKKGKR